MGTEPAILRTLTLFSFALILVPHLAPAAECGVGTIVEGVDLSPNGRIVEVGTQPPHVGWYKLVWDWNPKGDWYNPESWPMHAKGGTERCRTAKLVQAKAPPATPAPAQPRAAVAPVAPARPPAPPVTSLATGHYACSATGAGTFPIEIESSSSYSDRAVKSGSYSIDAGGVITFTSGSLEDQYAKVLGNGKFGLSSGPTRQFYAVCNRK